MGFLRESAPGGATPVRIWYDGLGFYGSAAEFSPLSTQSNHCLGVIRGSLRGVLLWTNDEVLVAHLLVVRNRMLDVV